MFDKHITLGCTLFGSLLLCASPLKADSGPGSKAATERDVYAGLSVGGIAIQPDGFNDVDTSKTAHVRASVGLFAGLRVGALPIAKGLPVYAEVGYQGIGRHTVAYKVPGGTSELTAQGHSVYAAAKVHLWTPGRFALYGKLGVARSSVDGSTPPGQTAIPINGHSTGLLWGLGVQYDFDSRLSLRAELTDYGNTSPKSSAAGVNAGLAYRF